MIDLVVALLIVLVLFLVPILWWARESLDKWLVASGSLSLLLSALTVALPSSYPNTMEVFTGRPWWEAVGEEVLRSSSWGQERALPVSLGFRGPLQYQSWWERGHPQRLLQFRGSPIGSTSEFLSRALAIGSNEEATVTVSSPNGDSDLFQLIFGPESFAYARTEQNLRYLFGLPLSGATVLRWNGQEFPTGAVVVTEVNGRPIRSSWEFNEQRDGKEHLEIRGLSAGKFAHFSWLSAPGTIEFSPEFRLWPLSHQDSERNFPERLVRFWMGSAFRLVIGVSDAPRELLSFSNRVPRSWYSLPSMRLFEPSYFVWRASTFFIALTLSLLFVRILKKVLPRSQNRVGARGWGKVSLLVAVMLLVSDLVSWPSFRW